MNTDCGKQKPLLMNINPQLPNSVSRQMPDLQGGGKVLPNSVDKLFSLTRGSDS